MINRWRRARRHRNGVRRGQSLVEFALILPAFLLLVVAALDLGRLFYAQMTITNAAREGALQAALDSSSFDPAQGCTDSNPIMCRVLTESADSFYTIASSDVSLSCSPAACSSAPVLGDMATVTVQGHFTLITPIVSSFTGGSVIGIASWATAQRDVEPDVGLGPSPSPTPTPAPTGTPTPTVSPTPTPSPPVCTAPVARFTASPTGGTYYQNDQHPGTLFTFTDTSTLTPIDGCTTVWSWDFGDGAGATGQGPQAHIYTAKGLGPNKTYTVTLVVSVSNGVDPTLTASWSVEVGVS